MAAAIIMFGWAAPAAWGSEPTSQADTGADNADSENPVLQRVDGFANPMGVAYDSETDRFFVANAADGGLSERGKGFISLLGAEGNIVERQWAKGLDAPKGMRVIGGALYVADRNRVVVFDLGHGRRQREIEFPGAYNLVDLTVADDGTLYAVDNGKAYGEGALYRFAPGKQPELVARGARFLNPLSIDYLDGKLVIGPEIGGNILLVDTAGEILDVVAMPMERLQGTVVRPGDGVGGLRRVRPHVIAASNRESGTIVVLDMTAPPPDLIGRIEALARGKGISFAAAMAERQKSGEATFGSRGVSKIASGSTVDPVDSTTFTVSGLFNPGKFAFDGERRRFIIPEIGKDTVVVVTIKSELKSIQRHNPNLY